MADSSGAARETPDQELLQFKHELRASEAKLRLGISVAGLGLGSMDYLADTITLDETAAALFALPANTPIPRSDVHGRFHPEDRANLAALIADVLDPDGSGFMAVDHRIISPDGTTRWVSARKQVEFETVHTGSGRRPTAGLLAVLDISERKATEAALSMNQARYRSALAAGRMVTWETDLVSKTRSWSQEAMELFGFNLADGRGQVGGETDEHRRSLHPDDRHLLDNLDEQANLQDSFAAEYRILKSDGTIRWMSGYGQVVARGPDGKAHHLVNIVADITDRKAAEANLRVSEVKYRRLFETAHDGVLLIDPVTRKITDANPFMTSLLDYSHGQLVGKELFEIGLLKDERANQDMIEQLKNNRQVRYEDLPLESKFGRQQQVEVVANLYEEDGHSVIQCNIRDITERKRIEITLKQNAALFATLVEQAPTGMYVVDSQFRLQQINQLALPVFSSATPLIGMDFSETIKTLWGAELGTRIVSIFRHTLATGERYTSPTFSEQRQDIGVEQAYEWEAQRVTLPDGSNGVACYFTDITERKKSERELLDSEAKFRATFENAAVGIAHVGPDGTWLDVNEQLCAIVGYSRDEILAKTFQDITHPDDLETDLDHVNQLRSGKADSYSMDKRYIRKDGTTVWANLAVGCVRNAGSAIEYFVSVIKDISDRKAAEQAHSETEARLRHAADAARLTYVEVDFTTGQLRTAENYSMVMGYAPPQEGTFGADPGAKLLLDHVAPQDRLRVEAAIQDFLSGTPIGKIEYTLIGDDHIERSIESVWSTELGPDGKAVRAFATNLDITERKRAETHVKALMAEVNHRSKNLLSVVQAVARQTAQRGDPSTFVARLAERIDGLAASQDLLVKNQWQGVEVSELVKAQLAHFNDLIGTRIAISGPSLRLTPAAAQGIGMAMHELATNAAKYGALSNSTGLVHINWRHEIDQTRAFVISWLEEGGPPVKAPAQHGFGQLVIRRMAEMSVGGAAEVDYRESGLSWKLISPIDSTLEPRMPAGSSR
jgi:PAS domain S-box-containing protein